MSATAFQRMRREAANKAASCAKEKIDETPTPEEVGSDDLSTMSVEDMKIYAAKMGLDLGFASSRAGILKKIKQAKE